MATKETRAAQAEMLRQEQKRKHELEAAILVALTLARRHPTLVGQTALGAALGSALVSGSLASWAAGVAAAERDLNWLRRETDDDIPTIAPEAPWGTMAQRANRVASNYTRSIKELVAALMIDGARDPIGQAVRLNRYRVTRAAVTENSAWFNSGRRETVTGSYRMSTAQARGGPRIVEIWDALLDACQYCLALNGERADAYGEFSGGARPGFVHAHCRCTSHFALEVVRLPAAA